MENTYNEAIPKMDYNPMSGRPYSTETEPVQTQDRTVPMFSHSINIQPLNRGFLVNVGCQSIAFESHEKMLKYLSEYLSDPRGFEVMYRTGEVLLNGGY